MPLTLCPRPTWPPSLTHRPSNAPTGVRRGRAQLGPGSCVGWAVTSSLGLRVQEHLPFHSPPLLLSQTSRLREFNHTGSAFFMPTHASTRRLASVSLVPPKSCQRTQGRADRAVGWCLCVFAFPVLLVLVLVLNMVEVLSLKFSFLLVSRMTLPVFLLLILLSSSRGGREGGRTRCSSCPTASTLLMFSRITPYLYFLSTHFVMSTSPTVSPPSVFWCPRAPLPIPRLALLRHTLVSKCLLDEPISRSVGTWSWMCPTVTLLLSLPNLFSFLYLRGRWWNMKGKSTGVILLNFINTSGSNVIFGNASKRMHSSKIRKWFARRITFKYPRSVSSFSQPLCYHCLSPLHGLNGDRWSATELRVSSQKGPYTILNGYKLTF